jgi:hypothetical protein
MEEMVDGTIMLPIKVVAQAAMSNLIKSDNMLKSF